MRANSWLVGVAAIVGVAGSAAGWLAVEPPHWLLRRRHEAVPMPERFHEAAWDYRAFRGDDTAKVALWTASDVKARSVVRPYLQRVLAIPRRQHLLVVAENWCPDAANSLPYLAQLADAAPNVDLKVLRKADAPDLLAKYPLGDRQATPLVVIMDSKWQVRGVWIEQPEALQRRIAALKADGLTQDAIRSHVNAWYAADSGRAMLDEITRLLDGKGGALVAAGGGAATCGGK
ncbi:MAG: thioredoxin family protein [Gemmatimonadaceae bacterium]